jgi:hypothetical protein
MVLLISLHFERPCFKGRDGVIPAKAGIQGFEIVEVCNSLDARFRGHEEL